MKPLKLSEVKASGWYINLHSSEKDPDKSDSPQLIYQPLIEMVELDSEGVWRSETGHGITLEQPDYFEEGYDFFVGPLEFK